MNRINIKRGWGYIDRGKREWSPQVLRMFLIVRNMEGRYWRRFDWVEVVWGAGQAVRGCR